MGSKVSLNFLTEHFTAIVLKNVENSAPDSPTGDPVALVIRHGRMYIGAHSLLSRILGSKFSKKNQKSTSGCSADSLDLGNTESSFPHKRVFTAFRP